MKTVNDIRTEFLSFFEGNDHKIVQSSPLVPQNDPTLMFVNAGMVQFKDLFTGKETRDYKRATSAQKCVRAGGKHNDLDNVGYTARHHTFFEMMGNFSFGDYFKEEAISYAWELVTKNFGLNPDKLLVTVHSSDEEAAAIWKKITGFSDDKIIRIPTSDNFWSMGDTGPCGPCTEIFYDHGEDIEGGVPGSPNEDGDRFVEIWNLVFMQYEQIDVDTRIDLPKPSVDTGMGLERMAAIMQGKHNNYDTDLFAHIIEHSAELTKTSPYGQHAASHRVIADHLRCAAFLLADGVMPSNEGRGYVLRRIMRRGMRHAHLLQQPYLDPEMKQQMRENNIEHVKISNEPLLYKLVPTLTNMMGDAYPELRRAEALVTETLKMEETRFKTTLERGLKLLDEETGKLGQGKKLSGEAAFKLYDTFGFPVDLTQDALRPQGIEVDMDGFNSCMEKQRNDARKAWKGSGDTATEKLWFELLEEHGATEFLGYKTETAEGQILAIIKDGEIVDSLNKDEEGIIITNQTPFYGESGGQVGDHGRIRKIDGTIEVNSDFSNWDHDLDNTFNVTDTQKILGKLFVHFGRLKKGKLSIGDNIKMFVDSTRRTAIRANHSATHLLHAALRQVLGDHVTQKGSQVDDKRLRFDISHPKGLTFEEMNLIETIVNNEIRANTKVITRLMGQEEAIEAGAMALFGEKYDDEVRVLTMGTDDFSTELCGGTHANKTGDIEKFKIISEGAVSAGIRRIAALTGSSVDEYLANQAQAHQDKINKLKVETIELRNELKVLGGEDLIVVKSDEDDLVAHNKMLQKQISELRQKGEMRRYSVTEVDGKQKLHNQKTIGNIECISDVRDDIQPKDLKPMTDDLKSKIGSGVVILIAVNEGKASLVVGVTDDLTGKINAVDLVKIGAEALGGKGGGGRPDMAQAGGPNAAVANDAVSAIESALA